MQIGVTTEGIMNWYKSVVQNNRAGGSCSCTVNEIVEWIALEALSTTGSLQEYFEQTSVMDIFSLP